MLIAVFKLLTSWQNSLNKGGFVGSILMHLSKAYDFLKDGILSAKLWAYAFSKKVLFLSYITNRPQRIKIGSALSDCANIVKVIPQCSILGLLLFNIFINDLFFFLAKYEFCYFADDNSLHWSGMNLDNIFTNLIQNM